MGAFLRKNGQHFPLFSIPEMFTIKPFVLGGLGGIWAAFASFSQFQNCVQSNGIKIFVGTKFCTTEWAQFSKIGSIFSCSQSQECVQWNEFFRKDGQDVACFSIPNIWKLEWATTFSKQTGSISPCVQLQNSVLGTTFLGKMVSIFPSWSQLFRNFLLFSIPKRCTVEWAQFFQEMGSIFPCLQSPKSVHSNERKTILGKQGSIFPCISQNNGQHFVLLNIQNCKTHLNPKVPTRKWAAFGLFYTQNSKGQTDAPKFFQKNGQHIALLQHTEPNRLRFFPEDSSLKMFPKNSPHKILSPKIPSQFYDFNIQWCKQEKRAAFPSLAYSNRCLFL